MEGFGVALPGQTIPIAAGLYARTGRLNLVAVLALGILATERFFARRGAIFVAGARFIDGLRQDDGIVAGVAHMRWCLPLNRA